MKPSSYQPTSMQVLTSANNGDTKTAAIPNGTSAIYVTVETTSCRMTMDKDGSGDPTVSGLIVQKDQMPWFMPIHAGAKLKFVSTAGTASVIQIAYLS